MPSDGEGGRGEGGAADWERLEPLLDELLERAPAERETRLAALAADQPALAAALRELLAVATADATLPYSAAAMSAVLADADDDDPQPARVGERLGPFRITGELGRGGMGTVYAAERVDGGFEQAVAIKVLRRGLDSEDLLRRFLAERRILARLEHPHIARLIDGGLSTDGLPWFAMERVDGRPITVAAEQRGLGTRERVALFAAVCDAVAFAHGERVVHRDLKPSNVLLDEHGQVKLLDFGIAKLLEPEDAGLTRTMATPMTPQYAAPEQLAGGVVSTATDVWQLGRLLGELLPSPLSRDLARIVALACHEEPARRYGSVDALAEDLRRWLDGRPVLARGDSLAYRARRFAHRHRAWMAAAALALALGGVVAWDWLRPRSAAGEVAAPPLQFELVSTFPGSHRQATFSPDGSALAFISEDAQLRPQVFVKRLAGGDPVQLTRVDPGAHRPRWSPRGDGIYFDIPGRGIWVVPPRGGAPRQLVTRGFGANLSPDGRRLVFEDHDGLWLASSSGAGVRRVGTLEQAVARKNFPFDETKPAFNADGTRIVYRQDRELDPERADLFEVDLASGAQRQLTRDDAAVEGPVWMPDGSGLIFSSGRRGGVTLWRWRPGADEPEPVTTGTGEDTDADVSRDGRRIVYTNARNLLRLMWLDPKTGERRQLLERRSAATHPAFDPSGQRLAVFARDGLGGRDVHLLSLRTDGSELRQLSGGTGTSEITPDFSNDGRWIYFYQSRGEEVGWRRMPADGGRAQTLVPGWTWIREHGPHVDPAGRRVVYTRLRPPRGADPARWSGPDSPALPMTLIRDLATGQERRFPTTLLWPRWSLDGRYIAGEEAMGDRESSRGGALLLCAVDGGACRQLSRWGKEPRWSRNGWLYFVRYFGYQGSRDPRVTELWRVRPAGGAEEHVADLAGPHPMHFFYDVSANGEVAWCEFVAGRQELWIADLPARR
jgi:Tol biopolymer transport system component